MSTDRRAAIAGFGAAVLLVAALGLASARQDGQDSSGEASAPPAVATEAVACDDPTRDRMARVIDAQLEAFAEDDWATALTYASDGFREGIDAGQLEDIITQGYPIAADAVGSRIGDCAVAGPFGQAVVTVEATSGREQELVYLLVFESGQWRISGAGDTGAGEPSQAV